MNNIVPLHRGVVPISPATNDYGMILGEPTNLYEIRTGAPIGLAMTTPGQPVARYVPWELGISGRNQNAGTAGETAPDLYDSFRSHEPIRDPAVGGRGGLVFMLLVAFAIGVLLALGGVL
jgi:hypothetical protein